MEVQFVLFCIVKYISKLSVMNGGVCYCECLGSTVYLVTTQVLRVNERINCTLVKTSMHA